MEKTEKALRQGAARSGRRCGAGNCVPYGWIVDGTLWMHKPSSYSSLEQALKRTAESHRRAVWDDQAVRVEIWLEKQGLAGIILPVTAAVRRAALRVTRLPQPDLSGRGG